MAYNDPETSSYSSYSPPPPFDPPPATGRTDGYGWQGQTPNPPQQPYQPYGQPTSGYYQGPMAPATSGYAIASLICSILGFIGVFGLGPILGIIFGHLAIREIDGSRGLLQGRGMAQAGLILGYISLGLVLLVLLFFIAVFVLGIGASLIAPNN